MRRDHCGGACDLFLSLFTLFTAITFKKSLVASRGCILRQLPCLNELPEKFAKFVKRGQI
jgi:hypothetical protein